MTKKTYVVITEERKYTIDLTEAELEQVRLHYHGFVRITEVAKLDFDAIAQELNRSK